MINAHHDLEWFGDDFWMVIECTWDGWKLAGSHETCLVWRKESKFCDWVRKEQRGWIELAETNADKACAVRYYASKILLRICSRTMTKRFNTNSRQFTGFKVSLLNMNNPSLFTKSTT